nr:receptor-like protein kinase feronia [Quercus suber]
MPSYLYYTQSYDQSFPLNGQEMQYSIDNETALEMLYRINVGGGYISPTEDTGMFQSWIPDMEYLIDDETSVIPVKTAIQLNFSEIPPYTAPEDVYRTAQTLGKDRNMNTRHNLTWELPVDSQFDYFVRLHFCEFQLEILDGSFHIFIANQRAEELVDVMAWSGGRKGVPVYKDYAVSMFGLGSKKKMNLSIILQVTYFADAILNGIEIFIVSNPSNNLVAPNPDLLPLTPPTAMLRRKSNKTTIIVLASGGVSGFTVLSVLGFLTFQLAKRAKDSGIAKGYESSTLPSSLCRFLSLFEIKEATNNFDNVFIIGVGGFGNVYKGYINGGATPVAIKRLKPGSQQGAQEFKTEIEMLSQLRHLHLVSLIGFCKDNNEMILVYDYMAHGTLCGHIYNTNNPLLSWKQRLKICIGAAHRLNYLHTGATCTVIHRDMKTTNILLDEQWLAKVIDFGLSKFGPTMSKSHVSTVVKGTFGYLDLEYYRFQQLTVKSDVYAFGVVLCEVLCGKPAILRAIEEEPISLAAWSCSTITIESLIKLRPSMNDVVVVFALELQESEENDDMLDVAETDMKDDDKLPLFPTSDVNESDDRIFNCSEKLSRTNSNSQVTVVS